MSIKSYKYVKFGENFHIEFDWDSGNDIREYIVQLDYQLTRVESNKQLYNIQDRYGLIVKEVINSKSLNNNQKKSLMTILYKMIAYTRDIKCGKGEYKLSYALLAVLAHMNLDFNGVSTLDMAKNALYFFVHSNNSSYSYGSWKDIKYFCNFWIQYGYDLDSTILSFAFSLIAKQIYDDFQIIYNYNYNNSIEKPKISFASKWVPREKSKYGYLYELITMHYFTYNNYRVAIKNKQFESDVVVKRITKEHKKLFRQTVSMLNKYLNTTQIHQCNNQWDNIDFKKVSSITYFKQMKSFLKLTDKSKNKRENRMRCSINFKKHMLDLHSNKTRYISPYEFVKMGIKLLDKDNDNTDVILLNILWEKNKDYYKVKNHNIIPIIDMTHNMELNKCVPLYSSIGLGIRISELSQQKNTILTISENPTVILFDKGDLFLDKLRKIFTVLENNNISFGVDGNIYYTINLLLQNCILNNISQYQMDMMNIVILSDMQTNDIINKNTNEVDIFKCINEKIADRFNEAGKKTIDTGYICPHIVYWNMRQTYGFPYNSSKDTNISVMSGLNFNNLNDLCLNIENSRYYKKNIAMLLKEKERNNVILHKSCIKKTKGYLSRWEKLQKKLNIERYKRMEKIFENI